MIASLGACVPPGLALPAPGARPGLYSAWFPKVLPNALVARPAHPHPRAFKATRPPCCAAAWRPPARAVRRRRRARRTCAQRRRCAPRCAAPSRARCVAAGVGWAGVLLCGGVSWCSPYLTHAHPSPANPLPQATAGGGDDAPERFDASADDGSGEAELSVHLTLPSTDAARITAALRNLRPALGVSAPLAAGSRLLGAPQDSEASAVAPPAAASADDAALSADDASSAALVEPTLGLFGGIPRGTTHVFMCGGLHPVLVRRSKSPLYIMQESGDKLGVSRQGWGLGTGFLRLPLADDIPAHRKPAARLDQLRGLGAVSGCLYSQGQPWRSHSCFDPNESPVLRNAARKHVILTGGLVLPVYDGDVDDSNSMWLQFVVYPDLPAALGSGQGVGRSRRPTAYFDGRRRNVALCVQRRRGPALH